MDAYGSDALRFTLARGANPGADVPISEEWVQGSRNFCTKLWNATRFALLNGATTSGDLPAADELAVADRWILSRLAAVGEQVDAAYEDFQFARTAEVLYHFVWDEVCDWYLEIAKLPLSAGGRPADVTRRVLGEVLDVVLRLLHPVVPFVSEALWCELTGGESLVVAAWPARGGAAVAGRRDAHAEAEISAVQRLVTAIRRFRSDHGLRPAQRVAARLRGIEGTPLGDHLPAIRSLARLSEPGAGFAPSARLSAGDVVVELDLAGTIDVSAERRRLDKERAAAQRELSQARAKLADEQFLAKAPERVVVGIRARLAEAEADLSRLDEQAGALPPS
jgi:valyl-tRNA synthetase